MVNFLFNPLPKGILLILFGKHSSSLLNLQVETPNSLPPQKMTPVSSPRSPRLRSSGKGCNNGGGVRTPRHKISSTSNSLESGYINKKLSLSPSSANLRRPNSKTSSLASPAHRIRKSTSEMSLDRRVERKSVS